MTKARRYFDGVAYKYTSMSSSGILGKIRENEKKSVMRLFSLNRRQDVLDAGCGSGFYSISLKEHGANVFGVDISPKMVEETKKQGIEAEVHDLASLNLERKFDKILCAGALEFCDDPQRVIENLKNHLREDGQIAILFPRLSIAGLLYMTYHRLHGVHINLFSLNKMESLLENADLEITQFENPDPLTCALVAKIKKTTDD